MGGSILPMLTELGQVQVYDFDQNHVPGETARDHGYWRDVGTLDAYYDAHMDLISVHPVFNLYNREWPLYTFTVQRPPAKFVAGGIASESMVAPGCIITGQVTQSVLSPGVVVEAGAVVQGSVLHDNVRIGQGAVVRRAILDKNVVVPPGATVGVNLERDRELYHASANGIIALGKGQRVL
jgi:glucose-1-phosphate adenylyltransferase